MEDECLVIHDGFGERIYKPESFQELMGKMSGASNAHGYNEVGGGFNLYYHIEPEGVTLHYRCEPAGSLEWLTKVTLYGKNSEKASRRISQGIERINAANVLINKAHKDLEALTF